MILTAHVTGAWQRHAECVDEDPELFFPVGNSAEALTQTRDAKTVCRRCPVMEQCLQRALEQRINDGVWGGLTEEERRAILRKRGRGTGRGRKKA